MADAKTTGASTQPNGNAQHRTHNDGSSGRAFTAEQKAAVIRVKKCQHTQFYEILGLEEVRSSVDDAGIKKAYRKLSLLTHPDKNGYDGADEAFKMVSRAFQILSDPDKKKRYDQFGGDPDNRFGGASAASASPFSGFARSPSGFGQRGGGSMFEEEISPEELFRQFFGGGLGGGFGSPFGGGFDTGPGFVFNLGGMGPGVRVHQFGGNRPRRRPPGANQPQPTAFDAFRNLLPLILLFLLPLLSSFLSGGSSTPKMPSFHLDTPVPPMSHRHQTPHLGTEYYVNPVDVQQWKRRDWTHMDNYVDNQLQYTLQRNCEIERRQQQSLYQEAQGWFSIDQDKLERARQMPMADCRRLNAIERKLRAWY